MSAEDSGRDIVVEISASAFERLVLHRVRTSLQLTCVDLDLAHSDTAGLAVAVRWQLGITDETLKHLALWPISASLSQIGDTPSMSLKIATRDGPKVLTLDLAMILQRLGENGEPLVPADLPIFALLGVQAPEPEIRVVRPDRVDRDSDPERGALAIGFDVSGHGDDGAWNAFTRNFLGRRNWAAAVDVSLVQTFFQNQLDAVARRTRHHGGQQSFTALIELDTVRENDELHTLGSRHDDNEQIRDDQGHLTDIGPAWDAIVPGFFGGPGPFHDLFCYRRSDGRTRIYSTDGRGGLHVVHEPALDAGWDVLVPGQFVTRAPETADRTDLLLYRRETGVLAVQSVVGQGRLNQVSTPPGLGHGDYLIVPLTFAGSPSGLGATGVVIYSPASRLCRVARVDGHGTITDVSVQTLARSWEKVVPLRLETGPALLFYAVDGNGAQVELDSVQADGTITAIHPSQRLHHQWDLIAVGDFHGTGHPELIGYDRADGLARFHSLRSDGLVRRLADHDNWRLGLDLIVPAALETGSRRGLVLYSTNSVDLRARLDWLRGAWGDPATAHARGEYHDPSCGWLSFEIQFFVTLQIEGDNGQLSPQVRHDQPFLDYWDGAQAAVCHGFLDGGPVGLIAGAVASVLGWVQVVTDAIAAGLVRGLLDRIAQNAVGELPTIDFAIGAGRFVGDQVAQSAAGLTIRGRTELDVPPPPHLVFSPWEPRLADEPSFDFYETPEHVCSGYGLSFPQRQFTIENRGPGRLILCAVELAGDPGFYLGAVDFPSRTILPPDSIRAALHSAPDGRSLEGLPLFYDVDWPEASITVGYRGETGSDSEPGQLRIVSNDPARPLLEVHLQAYSGGIASYVLDPPQLIEIHAANADNGGYNFVSDCRVVRQRVDPPTPAGGVTIQNTSDRPLYICDERITSEDPEVFPRVVAPLMIKPHEDGFVGIDFVPAEVGKTYRGTLHIRTGPATPATDITVMIAATLDPQAGEKTAKLGLDAATLGFVYDLVGEKLCVPANADICRTRGLFEPIGGDTLQVGLLTFAPVPPAGDVYLRDPDGQDVAHDFGGEPRRHVAVPFEPGPDGKPPPNPCIAAYEGISPGELARMRITVGGRILRRTALFADVHRPTDVTSAGGWSFVAGDSGIEVVDWRDPAKPRHAGQVEADKVACLALLGDLLVGANDGELLLWDVATPSKPKLVSRLQPEKPILAIAASSADGMLYAVDGEHLILLGTDDGRLRDHGVCAVPGGALELGLMPDGAYVRGDSTLTTLTVENGLAKIADEAKHSGHGAILGHYGRSIMLTAPSSGTEAFEWRGGRLHRIAEYWPSHWSVGFVPDREHRSLFRLHSQGVERWSVVPHRLDRTRFPEAFRLHSRR